MREPAISGRARSPKPNFSTARAASVTYPCPQALRASRWSISTLANGISTSTGSGPAAHVVLCYGAAADPSAVGHRMDL